MAPPAATSPVTFPTTTSKKVDTKISLNDDRGQALEDTAEAIEELHIKADLERASNVNAGVQEGGVTFRAYEDAADHVKAFYATQHEKQTYQYNIETRKKILNTTHAVMGIWEAMELLNTFIDSSDPDTELSQIQHLLQSAEAARAAERPDWFILTCLVHDLGKLLSIFLGSEQWEVVGDTFPVGCAFSQKNILSTSFSSNTDFTHPIYSTQYGIYSPGCGLDKLILSWGHDEYLYQVLKGQSKLPKAGLDMIRFHSFYPWHKEEAYFEFMSEGQGDWESLRWVRDFNQFDLYSKANGKPDAEKLKPYYQALIEKYIPGKIKW